MTLLELIQTRYPDATADQYEVQDLGDGPFFVRWEVTHAFEETPKPTYDEVMSWEDDVQANRRDELSAMIRALEGVSFATASDAEKWAVVEAMAMTRGALDDDSKIRALENWDARTPAPGGGEEFGEDSGGEFSG